MSKETIDSTALEAIEKLSFILGESASEVVDKYSVWFIWDSLAFMVFGALLAGLAWRFKPVDDDYRDDTAVQIGRGIVFVIGALIFFSNVPDLIGHEGIAIHQLIKDIRG